MYHALGLLVALVAFLLVNAIASLASAALARPLLDTACERTQAPRLLALRLFPSLASALVTLGLVLPAYALFEPRHSGERPSLALGLLAAAGLVVLAAGLRRGLASCLATARLVRSWSRTAERLALQAPLPVFAIRDPFPIVCLVGALRPRLFVARQVLDVLSPDELEAVVTHETAHWLAGDNLKRLLLHFSPDLLSVLPLARRLEREWARASELAADARAGACGAEIALDLSAALVKVARLAPASMPPTAAVSALQDGSDLALRVRRLVGEASSNDAREGSRRLARWLATGLFAAAVAAVAPDLLESIHQTTESVLRLLS
jgi:Zn-dependent protease with chaperone function